MKTAFPKLKKIAAAITAFAAALTLVSCAPDKENIDLYAGELKIKSLTEEEIMESLDLQIEMNSKGTAKSYKDALCSNPISPNVYCADPTGVEYNGRLYIYGTNDHQQYEAVGDEGKNTYEKIKSLVIFSTDDMVNWVYHGEIPVGEIAPWIYASWAPSIVSRVEDDGLTHFYLYFSNSGAGVGVLTSTDPVHGWYDPLGGPLIHGGTEGIGDCPTPFDPGAVIDDNGIGWLSFGAGVAKSGSDYQTKAQRIVRLGEDMISTDSEFAEIPTYYAFEASELNYINGEYVYTYNTSWVERSKWELKTDPPSACSMAYMTTKTPLDSDSWEYKGHYFINPGESGMNYSNNHTHIMDYKGEWYIFYHSLILQERAGVGGGFRSMCADKLNVNEKKVEIELTGGTRQGVSQIKSVNPFTAHSGAEMYSSVGTWYDDGTNGQTASKSLDSLSWISIKGADFSEAPEKFLACVKGNGRIEVRVDSKSGEVLSAIEFDCEDYTVVRNDVLKDISGEHDLYFVFSNENISLDSWQFD